MGSRLELHTLLEGALGSDNVYVQPPETIRMSYPSIVYERSRIRADYADNIPYILKKQYTVTVITQDPDSTIPDTIAQMELCAHDRKFVIDNLYHDIFTLFF